MLLPHYRLPDHPKFVMWHKKWADPRPPGVSPSHLQLQGVDPRPPGVPPSLLQPQGVDNNQLVLTSTDVSGNVGNRAPAFGNHGNNMFTNTDCIAGSFSGNLANSAYVNNVDDAFSNNLNSVPLTYNSAVTMPFNGRATNMQLPFSNSNACNSFQPPSSLSSLHSTALNQEDESFLQDIINFDPILPTSGASHQINNLVASSNLFLSPAAVTAMELSAANISLAMPSLPAEPIDTALIKRLMGDSNSDSAIAKLDDLASLAEIGVTTNIQSDLCNSVNKISTDSSSIAITKDGNEIDMALPSVNSSEVLTSSTNNSTGALNIKSNETNITIDSSRIGADIKVAKIANDEPMDVDDPAAGTDDVSQEQPMEVDEAPMFDNKINKKGEGYKDANVPFVETGKTTEFAQNQQLMIDPVKNLPENVPDPRSEVSVPVPDPRSEVSVPVAINVDSNKLSNEERVDRLDTSSPVPDEPTTDSVETPQKSEGSFNLYLSDDSDTNETHDRPTEIERCSDQKQSLSRPKRVKSIFDDEDDDDDEEQNRIVRQKIDELPVADNNVSGGEFIATVPSHGATEKDAKVEHDVNSEDGTQSTKKHPVIGATPSTNENPVVDATLSAHENPVVDTLSTKKKVADSSEASDLINLNLAPNPELCVGDAPSKAASLNTSTENSSDFPGGNLLNPFTCGADPSLSEATAELSEATSSNLSSAAPIGGTPCDMVTEAVIGGSSQPLEANDSLALGSELDASAFGLVLHDILTDPNLVRMVGGPPTLDHLENHSSLDHLGSNGALDHLGNGNNLAQVASNVGSGQIGGNTSVEHLTNSTALDELVALQQAAAATSMPGKERRRSRVYVCLISLL